MPATQTICNCKTAFLYFFKLKRNWQLCYFHYSLVCLLITSLYLDRNRGKVEKPAKRIGTPTTPAPDKKRELHLTRFSIFHHQFCYYYYFYLVWFAFRLTFVGWFYWQCRARRRWSIFCMKAKSFWKKKFKNWRSSTMTGANCWLRHRWPSAFSASWS